MNRREKREALLKTITKEDRESWFTMEMEIARRLENGESVYLISKTTGIHKKVVASIKRRFHIPYDAEQFRNDNGDFSWKL